MGGLIRHRIQLAQQECSTSYSPSNSVLLLGLHHRSYLHVACHSSAQDQDLTGVPVEATSLSKDAATAAPSPSDQTTYAAAAAPAGPASADPQQPSSSSSDSSSGNNPKAEELKQRAQLVASKWLAHMAAAWALITAFFVSVWASIRNLPSWVQAAQLKKLTETADEDPKNPEK